VIGIRSWRCCAWFEFFVGGRFREIRERFWGFLDAFRTVGSDFWEGLAVMEIISLSFEVERVVYLYSLRVQLEFEIFIFKVQEVVPDQKINFERRLRSVL